MPVIAIGGPIASGKSTVSKMIAALGYRVIDADKITAQLYEPGNEGYNTIKKYLPDFITENRVDKKKLLSAVMTDVKILKRLNELIHPLVFKLIESEIKAADSELIFVEVSVLFMNDYYKRFTKTIAVTSKPQNVVKRLMKRNGVTEMKAKEIIEWNKSANTQLNMADFIIENNGDLENLEFILSDILNKL